MSQKGDFLSTPALEYESWRTLVHSYCGRFNAQRIVPETFVGRISPRSISGLEVLDIQCNAGRVERTQRDIRLDGVDHYYALLQVAGQSTMVQNDQVFRLGVGDVVLMDAARPVTTLCDDEPAQWTCFHFPRRSLISHFGFEPHGGLCKRGGSLAGRLLFQTARDAVNLDKSSSEPSDAYMRFVIGDLMAALFVSSDPQANSRHGDKLFARLCSIIKGRFAEPDLNPGEVATEAGISMRYLQKLFTERGSSYSQFILSLRLDHAAQLLNRRELLNAKQPLSEIAYACGFNDYTHFARQFRRRFARTPGSHPAGYWSDSDDTSVGTDPKSRLSY